MNLSQVLFVFGVFLIDKGFSIKCYVCDSSEKPDCVDLKTNEIQPEECTAESLMSLHTWLFELNKIQVLEGHIPPEVPMVCQKIVAKKGNDGVNTTARFCQIETGETSPCAILTDKIQQNYDSISHCSTCHHDKCNSSDSLTYSSIALVLSSFLLKILKF
ncbi:hypothetical protein ACFFRR_002844 [Megaselia abdita]